MFLPFFPYLSLLNIKCHMPMFGIYSCWLSCCCRKIFFLLLLVASRLNEMHQNMLLLYLEPGWCRKQQHKGRECLSRESLLSALRINLAELVSESGKHNPPHCCLSGCIISPWIALSIICLACK